MRDQPVPTAVPPTLYYAPSGKVARSAVLAGVGYGLAVVPGALLYAWVTMRAPAWLNAIVLMLSGLWLAVVVNVVARKGRVRSRRWIERYAAALALAAWYGQWALWMALAMHRQQEGRLLHSAALLAVHPAALWTGVLQLLRHNAWGLAPLPMAAIWLLELYVLVQMAPVLGRDRVAQPFCEVAGTWAGKIDVRRKFAGIARPAAVVALLEQAPDQIVSVLSPWAAPAPEHAEVTLYRCQDGAYVSIRNVVLPVDGKRARLQHVVEALRLPAVDVDALREKLVARADAGAPDAAPVAPELAGALALFQAARCADALARAQPHVQARERMLRVDANRLCASASMRLERWRAACGYWAAVAEDEPTVGTALHLAVSAVMAGDGDRGLAAFARARALNAATREQPPLALLTAFVSALDMAGRPASAMPWLDEIRECYCACRVTDPTVLYANRMPLLHEFLTRSAPIVAAALGREPGLRWFAAMLGRLDDAGNVALGQWLDEQARSVAL